MHNTYKSGLTLIIIALLTFSASAQKRTYSPYSRYGIGELQDGGFGRNAGMGRTGIALQNSYNLNNMNPSSYSGMDSLSFYFEGGLMNYSQKLKTSDATSKFSDMHFDYFAIGFPIAKWGFMSFGLQPASAVGYDFYEDSGDSGDGNYSRFSAIGNGNTTKTYAGISFSPIKNLSVGMHGTYLFGKTRNSSITQFPNDAFALKIGSQQTLRINDFYLDFGLQYKVNINDKHNVVLGGIYSPKTGINAKVTKLVAQGTSLESDGSMVIAIDTLQYVENELKRSAFEMPEKMGVGIAYNIKDALTLTAEYTLEKWSEAKFPDDITETADMQKWAFGGEVIPNERSASSYLARLRYRFGTYYKKDYLILNEHQLTDFGISFGVGLPLKRTKTSFNLAFEWGQRGTTDYNLVKENYAKLTMNLTLHEFWFVKRKFD